jgi:hypothetical protein
MKTPHPEPFFIENILIHQILKIFRKIINESPNSGNNITRKINRKDDIMRTFLGFIFKLIGVFVAAWISYKLIEHNTLLWVFIAALAVSIINYLIGDMLILPRFGNVFAALCDAVLAVIIVWIMDLLSVHFTINWLSTLVFAILIFIFELFLHKYLVHDEDEDED